MAAKKTDSTSAIVNAEGNAYGPCGGCAFYREDETPQQHTTGRCHGGPPVGPMGWPVVQAVFVGCAVFQAK